MATTPFASPDVFRNDYVAAWGADEPVKEVSPEYASTIKANDIMKGIASKAFMDTFNEDEAQQSPETT